MPIICYAARSPLGRTSYPSAIPLLSLALTFIRKLIRNEVTGVGGFWGTYTTYILSITSSH
ncbi:hypothetical protein KMI6_10 [Klebsiella phage KMI6]|uniref:Uncharacterized protein n=1 Tax=Klebsiella phage KMI6 TaxID=2601617 RepID=A0A5B9N936_9CAUD|nr:hypothetical protein KMI6_10 [Klebsiella phage KMI6]